MTTVNETSLYSAIKVYVRDRLMLRKVCNCLLSIMIFITISDPVKGPRKIVTGAWGVKYNTCSFSETLSGVDKRATRKGLTLNCQKQVVGGHGAAELCRSVRPKSYVRPIVVMTLVEYCMFDQFMTVTALTS